MVGEGFADSITLTLGAAFEAYTSNHPGEIYTGRVTMAKFSFGREKGMILNFIMADESYAFTVQHYQKKQAVFGKFYEDDPWRMQTESGSSPEYPETGILIEGITVTVVIPQ